MASAYTPLLIFSDQSLVLVKNHGPATDLMKEPCVIKWFVSWDNIAEVTVRNPAP